MNCGRCGSDRLFQFEADPRSSKRAVNPGSLPLVCRSCGQITVDGTPLVFPEAFESQAKDLAEAAAAAGADAVAELANDPNARVANYFAKVYREAYLDGFLRCLAFYQHNAKEGKLKRLRELWGVHAPIEEHQLSPHRVHSLETGKFVDVQQPGTTTLMMPTSSYDEFDQLMMLGPVPD